MFASESVLLGIGMLVRALESTRASILERSKEFGDSTHSDEKGNAATFIISEQQAWRLDYSLACHETHRTSCIQHIKSYKDAYCTCLGLRDLATRPEH